MQDTRADTKQKIEAYFKDKRKIERLQARIAMLTNQVRDVQQDIDNSNIFLFGDIQAVNYTKDKVQSLGAVSQQENEIERAFRRLEQQKERLETEIVQLKAEQRDLQQNSYDIEHIIGLLTEEARKFINMRYRQGKSLNYISCELNMSVSSVSRLSGQILKDISNWIYTLS